MSIAQKLKFNFYNGGEVVFKEGDYGEDLFIILQGKVEVLIKNRK